MKTSLTHALLAVLLAPVAALVPMAASSTNLNFEPSPLLSIDQNRTTVVDRVVATWGDALADADAGLNKKQLRALLAGLRSDQLLAASLAGSLDGLRNVIANALTSGAPVAAGLVHTKTLGDAADDLVYTPVVPCRLADTRSAGGVIAANTARDFKVWVASGGFTAQGGDPGNCAIPADPAAVALNLTVVNPAGGGNLIAYPTGAAVPNTSTLNFQAGTTVLGNGAIVPACRPGCANQVTMKANGPGTHLVIDIVGYFKAPSGPVVPGGRVFSGSVNLDGSPQVPGFTVQHIAATGAYRVDFPAGTFAGSAGKFPMPTVMPISIPNIWVTGVALIGPIAADGSASFSVQFSNNTDTLFAFRVQPSP